MEKENARTAEAVTSANTIHDVTDTAAEAQRMRLLYALRSGPLTTFEARTRLNITMPAARVSELRDMGYQIFTERISVCDENGRQHHRVARYVLIRECSQEKAA